MVASGATIPQRAPASIDMLHSVSRPSIDKARIALPANSIAWPVRAAGADVRDDRECDVFRRHSGCDLAVDGDAHAFGLSSARSSASSAHARLRTRRCRTHKRRSAPCVDVWLSPQTISRPGSVSPCSGPTTCTMPWRGSSQAEQRDPMGRCIGLELAHHACDFGIGNSRDRDPRVGT